MILIYKINDSKILSLKKQPLFKSFSFDDQKEKNNWRKY